MPSRAEVVDLVDAYVAALDAQDVDEAAALFAEDARQEDPVGEGVNVGRASIRELFEQAFSLRYDVRREGPVTVHGRHAVFRVRIEIPAGRTPFVMLVSNVVEVDPDCRFSSLRAVPDSRAALEG